MVERQHQVEVGPLAFGVLATVVVGGAAVRVPVGVRGPHAPSKLSAPTKIPTSKQQHGEDPCEGRTGQPIGDAPAEQGADDRGQGERDDDGPVDGQVAGPGRQRRRRVEHHDQQRGPDRGGDGHPQGDDQDRKDQEATADAEKTGEETDSGSAADDGADPDEHPASLDARPGGDDRAGGPAGRGRRARRLDALLGAARGSALDQHRHRGHDGDHGERHEHDRLADAVVQHAAQVGHRHPDGREGEPGAPTHVPDPGGRAGQRGDPDDEHAAGGGVLRGQSEQVDQRRNGEGSSPTSQPADDEADDQPQGRGRDHHQRTIVEPLIPRERP